MNNYPTYKLGEICETTSGGTPNRKNDAYYGGSIPWVKSGELGRGVIYETEEYITEEAIKESSAKIFPKGTLLIALYGATIGKLGFLGVPAATNQAVCGIFENEKIDLHFLSYYLFHKRNDLIAQGTGGAQPNISQTILKNLSIPLPPLPTQRTIVTRIETLFAELDKGVEKLKTAQQQLKAYRQAVLNDCLTKGSEKWENVKLGDVAEKIFDGPFGSHLKGDDYVNSGIRVVRLENVKSNFFDDTKQSFVSKEKYETIKRHTVYPTDLIMSTFISEEVKVCQLPEYIGFAVNKADCIGIRLKPIVSCDFIKYYLSLRQVYVQLEIQVHGATRPRVNTTQIKNIEIEIPSLPEQQRIVQEIETRLSQAELVEASIEQSLQQAEALRQSILKKAFSGELV